MDSYDLAEYNDLRAQIRDTKGSLDQALLAGFPSVAAIWTLGIGLTNGFQHVYWPFFLAAAFIALFFYHFAITQDYQVLRLATYIRMVHERSSGEATAGVKSRRAPYWETFLYDVRVRRHEPSAIPVHPASSVNVFIWYICCSSALAIVFAAMDPIQRVFGKPIPAGASLYSVWIEVAIAVVLALIPIISMLVIWRSSKRALFTYTRSLETFAAKTIGLKGSEERSNAPTPIGET